MSHVVARFAFRVPNSSSSSASSAPDATGDSRRVRDAGRPALFPSIGLTGGAFGGLLGVGGGSAIAPLLLLLGGLRPACVAGTTLATVLLISAVGSGTYASLGHVDMALVWPIAAGSMVGAVLGALSARRLSARLMVGLFLLLLPYFAVKELWPSLAAPVISTDTASLAVLGFATGFSSGLLGIGGASLIVPSLVGFFLIDHIAAQGIAITVALADSTAGVAAHARSRNIDYRVFLRLAPPAVVAAIAGAVVSHHLPEAYLRVLFGTFMLTIWAAMLARWTRSWR